MQDLQKHNFMTKDIETRGGIIKPKFTSDLYLEMLCSKLYDWYKEVHLELTQLNYMVNKWYHKSALQATIWQEETRETETGAGVFLQTSDKYICSKPSELNKSKDIEMVWFKFQVTGSKKLFVYSVYRPQVPWTRNTWMV